MPSPESIRDAVLLLAKTRVLVGIPVERSPRPGEPITNAALGYIHEFGSPARNIPARPFLVPGVANSQPQWEKYLKRAAQDAVNAESPESAVKDEMSKAGTVAANAVHMHIQAGIPPPLKQASVRGSRTVARRSGSPADATPLIDTGDLLRSITWVLEMRGSRTVG